MYIHILFDFSFGDLFTWDQDFMKQKKIIIMVITLKYNKKKHA